LKSKTEKKLGHDISKSIVKRFFIAIVGYIVLIELILLVSRLIFSRWIWQPYDKLYQLLNIINTHQLEFVIILAIIGLPIIFSHYWRKTLDLISTIAYASEILVKQENEIIRLPNELREVELRMNQAKQDAIRNAEIAKEAEQRKNDLIVYLAHDIRTPLTSIIGYLNLLDEAPDMPSAQRAKYVHITLEKAYRLEQLINEFFEITRFNFHTMTLSKQNIDLSYMLMQMKEEFYPLLSGSRKQIMVYTPETLMVYSDPDKLARVFNNILKNAIAYSEDNSTIEITAKQQEDIIAIVFKNTGSIPKEKLSAIFEKFYRLDEARSSGKGGAGLGLAIAKEIITLHGGRIHAESDETSTSFTVELPVAPGILMSS
jgi:two-component system sensor histidine kinase VanS